MATCDISVTSAIYQDHKGMKVHIANMYLVLPSGSHIGKAGYLKITIKSVVIYVGFNGKTTRVLAKLELFRSKPKYIFSRHIYFI